MKKSVLNMTLDNLKESNSKHLLKNALIKHLNFYKCDILTNTDLPVSNVVDNLLNDLKQKNLL